MNYKASDPKYKTFPEIFGVYRLKSTQPMIFRGFRKIGKKMLLLYGHDIPQKSSFLLYNIQFNSSDFQSVKVFKQNLVFYYSIGPTAIEYAKKKNLQNCLLVENRIFLSPILKMLNFHKISKHVNYRFNFASLFIKSSI